MHFRPFCSLHVCCLLLGIVGSGLLLGGCASASRSGHIYVASPLPANKPAEGRPSFGMPILLPASDWAIVPFAMERQLRMLETETNYGPSVTLAKDSYRPRLLYFRPTGVVWHNAVFENQLTGESHLLLDRKAMITQFTAIAEPLAPNEKPLAPELLLFAIAEHDTNGDGVISEDDATRAYVCDIDGSNLRAATPAGTQLGSVTYDFDQHVLYLAATPDSNGDKRFNSDDITQLLRFTRASREGVPVISDELRRKAESLLR